MKNLVQHVMKMKMLQTDFVVGVVVASVASVASVQLVDLILVESYDVLIGLVVYIEHFVAPYQVLAEMNCSYYFIYFFKYPI